MARRVSRVRKLKKVRRRAVGYKCFACKSGNHQECEQIKNLWCECACDHSEEGRRKFRMFNKALIAV